LATLEYFIENGDEFAEVYRRPEKKSQFEKMKKYAAFESWKGTNEWEI
jgi:hypothetical protein